MIFDRNVFVKRLISLREERSIKQKDLADGLKISRPSVTNYENGQSLPDLQKLVSIAEILNTSADYLLGISEDSKRYSKSELAFIKKVTELCASEGFISGKEPTDNEFNQLYEKLKIAFSVIRILEKISLTK